MKALELIVLSGPNGAGKSTLSEGYVPPGTDIFDGDKEMAILKHRYPMTDSGTLYEAANGVVFAQRKEQAIRSGNDFAFETNFRSETVMDSVAEFQRNGYRTTLYHIGLPSVEASMNRVDIRVKSGGHFVDPENITQNYERGLENLAKFYDRFDQVNILESEMDQEVPFRMSALMRIEKGIITYKIDQLPEWAQKIVEVVGQRKQSEIDQRLRNVTDVRPSKERGRDKGNDFGLGM
ncbi:MAG: zeta toxin family protein [Pedobacter sp.]